VAATGTILYVTKQVLERNNPPNILTLLNKLKSSQLYDFALNYRNMHRVV
jgi:hypothetical protein